MARPRVVFLLGPPGAGKTTLGSAACARLGIRFVDLPEDAQLGIDEYDAGAGADVVALPWRLQNDAGILRRARRLGSTIALWAHPETLRSRARQPVTFTPRQGLVKGHGFGRHGTSCLEFRRLDRGCDFTLDLDGLSESEAANELADLISEIRECDDPAARLDAIRADVRGWFRADNPRRPTAAVEALADRMSRFLFLREAAGASPRSLNALRSDLQAAAILVFMYEPATDGRILESFGDGPPLVYEFGRKFTDSPALVERYERNLRAFAEFVGETASETA
jgi:hypothetical protein